MTNKYMKSLTTKICLIAIAFFSGTFLLLAQVDSNEPVTTPPDGSAVARHMAHPTLEERVQQLTAQQYVRVMTEEQRTNYNQALQDMRPRFQEIQTQIRALRRSLLEIQFTVPFDAETYRAKADAAAKLQAEADLLNAQAFAKVLPSLTVEQISKIRNRPLLNRAYGGSETRHDIFPPGAPPPVKTNAARAAEH